MKTHHPGAFTEHDEKLLAALAVKIDEKSMQVKTSPEVQKLFCLELRGGGFGYFLGR